MIRFAKPLNASDIIDDVNRRVKEARRNYDLYNTLLNGVIKEHEGQKITKRLEGWAEKVLDAGYLAHYRVEYGMYKLLISGNGIEYRDAITFYLGYTSESDTLEVDAFVKQNQWAALEGDRADLLENLQPSHVINSVNAWNNALSGLQAINEWAQQYGYPVQGFFDLTIR